MAPRQDVLELIFVLSCKAGKEFSGQKKNVFLPGILISKSAISFVVRMQSKMKGVEVKPLERPITYLQVQQMTGLPLGTLYSLVSRRQIPHMRMGVRSVRFNPTEIRKWIKSVDPKIKKGSEI